MHIRSHFLFKPFKGFPAQINENPKSLLCSLRSYVIFSYLLFEFLNYNSFLKSFCSSHTGIITAFQTHKVVCFFRAYILFLPLHLFLVCSIASFRSLVRYLLPQRVILLYQKSSIPFIILYLSLCFFFFLNRIHYNLPCIYIFIYLFIVQVFQ